MWSFFCETHRQELVTTLERFVHPHTMRGPVNGYQREHEGSGVLKLAITSLYASSPLP